MPDTEGSAVPPAANPDQPTHGGGDGSGSEKEEAPLAPARETTVASPGSAGADDEEELVSAIDLVPTEIWCITFSFVDHKTLQVSVPAVCTIWREACRELQGILDFGWWGEK